MSEDVNEPKATTVKLSKEDARILHQIRKKLGIGNAPIVRIAIRRLAERLETEQRDGD